MLKEQKDDQTDYHTVSKRHEMSASRYKSTVLSTVDGCWTVVRENRSWHFLVLTWAWFGDVGMKTMPVSVLIPQVWSFSLERHTLCTWIDRHVFGQKRFWFYWPCFLFCRFLHCSRLVILGFQAKASLWKNYNGSSSQNEVLFHWVCFNVQWPLWGLQLFECYGLLDSWIPTNIDQPGFT